jgi:hypothetical protein
VLQEFQEELTRADASWFKCIFPTPRTYTQYQPLFDADRPKNLLLAKYMLLTHQQRAVAVAHRSGGSAGKKVATSSSSSSMRRPYSAAARGVRRVGARHASSRIVNIDRLRKITPPVRSKAIAQSARNTTHNSTHTALSARERVAACKQEEKKDDASRVKVCVCMCGITYCAICMCVCVCVCVSCKRTCVSVIQCTLHRYIKHTHTHTHTLTQSPSVLHARVAFQSRWHQTGDAAHPHPHGTAHTHGRDDHTHAHAHTHAFGLLHMRVLLFYICSARLPVPGLPLHTYTQTFVDARQACIYVCSSHTHTHTHSVEKKASAKAQPHTARTKTRSITGRGV